MSEYDHTLEHLSSDEVWLGETLNIRQAFLDALELPPEPVQFSPSTYGVHQMSEGTSGSVRPDFYAGVMMPSISLVCNDDGTLEAHAEGTSLGAREYGRIVARHDPGSVANALVLGSHSVTELEDISRFLLDSNLQAYFERGAASDVIERTDYGPRYTNLGRKNSDHSQGVFKMAKLHQVISRQLLELVATSNVADQEIAEAANWFENFDYEHRLRITRSLETAARLALTNPTGQNIPVILKVVESLYSQGYLRNPQDNGSVIGQPKLLIEYPELAAIVQTDLANRTTDETKHGERAYMFIARKIMYLLLEKYADDPTRHQSNAEKVRLHIFPDRSRPDTLSRQNLLALANHVNAQSDGDVQLRRYGMTENGVVADAFTDVLSITRSRDTSKCEAQEIDDRLYASIIGMMLEQRSLAAAALRSASLNK